MKQAAFLLASISLLPARVLAGEAASPVFAAPGAASSMPAAPPSSRWMRGTDRRLGDFLRDICPLMPAGGHRPGIPVRMLTLILLLLAAIAAGKHIHIDKPAGESLPRFQKILYEAKQKKLMVQMGYMYRYNPAVVLLRQFLAQGWLGDVFEVHAVMSKVVDPPARRALAEYKGGMMFELGCHLIDLVVGVLGKPAQVFGMNQHAAKVDDGLLDNSMAVFSYPAAIASVKTAAMEVDGGERRHLVVCGTGGTFHIQPLDNPTAKITLAQERPGYKKGSQEIKFPKYARYGDDAADMARVIRGEKADSFGPAHDLAVQETILKACGLPTG